MRLIPDTIPIRGGLGDIGGYVYVGCFAHPVREYGGPVFPPYWADAHIPRTDRPARFVPRVVAPFGARWGLVNRWALVSPSHIA